MLQCLQPAKYCAEYPILSYKLLFRSEQTGTSNEVSINSTEDDNIIASVVLTHSGLENNQKYYYAVAAVNNFGMATSHQHGNWTHFSMPVYIINN